MKTRRLTIAALAASTDARAGRHTGQRTLVQGDPAPTDDVARTVRQHRRGG